MDRSRGLLFVGTGNTYEEPAAPMSDSLLAIDYTTGQLEWFRQFTAGDVYTIFGTPPQGPDADIGAAPNLFTIDGQDVVGVGDKAGVYAVLDRDTGATVWARQLTPGAHLGGVMMTSAYGGEVIYVGSNVMVEGFDYDAPINDSVTFALDATDGSILWQTDMEHPSFGALTLANGVLYQPTVNGILYALDASDGSILWSEDLGADLGGGCERQRRHGARTVRVLVLHRATQPHGRTDRLPAFLGVEQLAEKIKRADHADGAVFVVHHHQVMDEVGLHEHRSLFDHLMGADRLDVGGHRIADRLHGRVLLDEIP